MKWEKILMASRNCLIKFQELILIKKIKKNQILVLNLQKKKINQRILTKIRFRFKYQINKTWKMKNQMNRIKFKVKVKQTVIVMIVFKKIKIEK